MFVCNFFSPRDTEMQIDKASHWKAHEILYSKNYFVNLSKFF